MLTAADLDAMEIGQIVVDLHSCEWTKRADMAWVSDHGAVTSRYLNGNARRKESHVEQPMPTASTGPSMHYLAVKEIEQRRRIGMERYQQPLRAMNGRDAVRDTIEELADGLAYALQIREERRLLREELEEFAREVDRGYTVTSESLRDLITRYFPEETS